MFQKSLEAGIKWQGQWGKLSLGLSAYGSQRWYAAAVTKGKTVGAKTQREQDYIDAKVTARPLSCLSLWAAYGQYKQTATVHESAAEIVIPGHGPNTTIGRVREGNPYLK